jgi:hypothetical protein
MRGVKIIFGDDFLEFTGTAQVCYEAIVLNATHHGVKMWVYFDAQKLGVLWHRAQYGSGGTSRSGAQFNNNIGRSDIGGRHNAPLKETRTWYHRPNLKGVLEEFLEENQPSIHQVTNWFDV